MSWKIEIYRALFVAFGAFEIITNLKYLFTPTGIRDARKQHGELPDTSTEMNMRTKIICMLISGILFLVTGVLSYITHDSQHFLFEICLILFSGYAFVEALYYRYRNTFGFFFVSVLLVILYNLL